MAEAQTIAVQPGLIQALAARRRLRETMEAQLQHEAAERIDSRRAAFTVGGRRYTVGDIVIGAGMWWGLGAAGLKGHWRAAGAVAGVYLCGESEAYLRIRRRIDSL